MIRLVIVFALFAGTSMCAESSPPDDAADDARDAGGDAPVDDAWAEPPPDASRDFHDFLCTGRPVPPGLPCMAQDIDVVGPCGGHGGVAFDGLQCLIVRGAECAPGGTGVFDSIEECGVSCAAAGQCPLGDTLWVFPKEGRFPDSCTDAPAECIGMRVDLPLPAHCAVWGLFSQLAVYSTELPFPEQWEILWSLTMAPQYVGRTYCSQEGS